MYIHGVTLIEVMVSLFLISLSILAVDAVLLSSMFHTQKAYETTIATHQILSMVERLHVFAKTADINSQIILWNRQNSELLPHGVGEVSGVFPIFRVSLHWGNKRISCEEDDLYNRNCIVVKVYEA